MPLSKQFTLVTAVWAANPSAVAGNPLISFLSVITFSYFLWHPEHFPQTFAIVLPAPADKLKANESITYLEGKTEHHK